MNFNTIDQWISALAESGEWLRLSFTDNLSHHSIMLMREDEMSKNWNRHHCLFEGFQREIVNGFGRVNAGDAALQKLTATLHNKFAGLQPQFKRLCDGAAEFWSLGEGAALEFRFTIRSHQINYRITQLESVKENRAERLRYEKQLLKGTDTKEGNSVVRFSDEYIHALRENRHFEPIFSLLTAEYYATRHFLQPYFDTYGLNETPVETAGLSSTNQEPQPTEPKKGRKKEKVTHKQQMLLAEMLGLFNHPLLMNLKPKERGIILGELLNRSVDDTENMLNPETSVGDERLNWKTDYNKGKVFQFLRENGAKI